MKTTPISVTLIDSCGSDLSVVNAARVSFYKESEWDHHIHLDKEFDVLKEKDAKLINYLAKHEHLSPFNHAFLSFRVKAPIFVARQLVKHKFLPWNEVSRRYVTDDLEFYVPSIWRKKAENVKQGSSKEDAGKPVRTGKCLYCGGELPKGHFKYCSDNHQVYHSQERLPYNTKFSRWKASAKARGVPFTITEVDLDWPKHCPYLDVELNYLSDDKADNVASLDKIVPELGYVPGNVMIISNLANRMKSSATKEQILAFAKNAGLMHGGIFTDQAPSYEKYLEQTVAAYNRMIDDGFCPEQARSILPQSLMTTWIWSGTLGAFCAMLKLRLKEDTQEETREVATLISKEVQRLFPVSFGALVNE